MEKIKNYLEALGKITREAGYLEKIIEITIYQLIAKNEQIGQIVVAPMPFRQRKDLLMNLAKYWFSSPQDIEKIKKLLEKADKAMGKRNTMIHSYIDESNKSDEIIIIQREKSRYKVNEVKIDDLDKIAQSLGQIGNEIAEFIKEVRNKGLIKDTVYGCNS